MKTNINQNKKQQKHNIELKNGYEVLAYNSSVPQCVKQKIKYNKMWAILLSFASGLINGFFGGGAGLIIVVLLQKVFNLSQKQSHATAVFIVFPLCVISLILYILTGSFDFNNSYFIVCGVALGGLIGATLLKKLQPKIIGIVFSCIVIGCAIKMFFDVVLNF